MIIWQICAGHLVIKIIRKVILRLNISTNTLANAYGSIDFC